MFMKALYYFTIEDEKEVSDSLLLEFPNLKFVNGQRWPTSNPPVVAGIQECNSGIAYLWPSDLVPELPYFKLPRDRQYDNIKYQGATSGPVIQFIRCLKKKGILEMGQCDAFIEDAQSPLGRFHIKLVKFVKKRYRCGVDNYCIETGKLLDKNDRSYLVGKSILRDRDKAPRLIPNALVYSVPIISDS